VEPSYLPQPSYLPFSADDRFTDFQSNGSSKHGTQLESSQAITHNGPMWNCTCGEQLDGQFLAELNWLFPLFFPPKSIREQHRWLAPAFLLSITLFLTCWLCLMFDTLLIPNTMNAGNSYGFKNYL
jgi:hypothetical protein